MYTRRQVNVIYRANKEGKLNLSAETIKRLYDWADHYSQFLVNEDIVRIVVGMICDGETVD